MNLTPRILLAGLTLPSVRRRHKVVGRVRPGRDDGVRFS
jgi:hypothetical protein